MSQRIITMFFVPVFTALFVLVPQFAFANSQTYSTPGAGAFTVPAGVTSINVFVIGGGGGGGGGIINEGGGGGGGCGGAVNGGTISVTPGEELSVTVGAGGNGGGKGQNGKIGGTSQIGSYSAAGGSYGGKGQWPASGWYGPPGGSGGGSGGGGGGNPYCVGSWCFLAPSYLGGTAGNNPSHATNYYPPNGYCTGGGWSVDPATTITKTSYTAGSGGWGRNSPSSYAYCGGGGGGGVIIDGSSTDAQSGHAPTSGTYGPSCQANGGKGYGAGGGGSYYAGGTASGGAGAPGVVYIEWDDPATCTISINPSSVNQGTSATLTWSSSGLDDPDDWLYIEGIGYVQNSGSTSITPSQTTTYTGTASNEVGTGLCEATLTVHPSCTLEENIIEHGDSITAYQDDAPAYDSSCVSQTRTCTNGTLSGSYQYASCTVGDPSSCTLDGATLAHGESHTFYSEETAPSGGSCSSLTQERTCTNGTLSGSSEYQYASCGCTAAYSCSSQTIQYTDSSCAVSDVTTCVAPSFCSPGVPTCVYPPMGFVPFGEFTGHLIAVPQVVFAGDTTRLYWNVDNAASCTVTGNGDSWSLISSGASGLETSPIVQQTVYTLHCIAPENTVPPEATEETIVNVLPIFQEI